MVTYQVFGLCNLIEQLLREEAFFRAATIQAATSPAAADPGAHIVPQWQRDRLRGMLNYATQCADKLELQAVHDRIELFTLQLNRDLLFQECAIQIRTLKEAFDSGIQYIGFFYYTKDKLTLLHKVHSDWSTILRKINDLGDAVTSAVDCYAFDQNLASVFHLMRIMERGVQAFGKKLGVDIVKKNPGRRVSGLSWEQILNELNPKLKAMPQGTLTPKAQTGKI